MEKRNISAGFGKFFSWKNILIENLMLSHTKYFFVHDKIFIALYISIADESEQKQNQIIVSFVESRLKFDMNR